MRNEQARKLSHLNGGVPEKPVGVLFVSISSMEVFAELDGLTAQMKSRLEDLFTDVKPKGNKKWLDGITYYSSGLCFSAGNVSRIVLSPWEAEENDELEKEKNKKKLKDDIEQFTRYNPVSGFFEKLQLYKAYELPISYTWRRISKKTYKQIVTLSALDISDEVLNNRINNQGLHNLTREVSCVAHDILDFSGVPDAQGIKSLFQLARSMSPWEYDTLKERRTNLIDKKFSEEYKKVISQVFGEIYKEIKDVPAEWWMNHRSLDDCETWQALSLQGKIKLVHSALQAIEQFTRDSKHRALFVAAGLANP